MVGQVKSGLLLNPAYLECCFCYRHVSFSDFKRFRRRMKHYVRGLLGFLQTKENDWKKYIHKERKCFSEDSKIYVRTFGFLYTIFLEGYGGENKMFGSSAIIAHGMSRKLQDITTYSVPRERNTYFFKLIVFAAAQSSWL